jgi:hypothetical protein
MNALQWVCSLTVSCALLAVAAPARAQTPPRSMTSGQPGLAGPDDGFFAGVGYGLLVTSGVWIGEAILGAEFEDGLISPPFSWINVLAGGALCWYVAATAPHDERVPLERATAAGTTGVIIGVHGAFSLLRLLGDRAPSKSEFALDLSLDARAEPTLRLHGSL